MLTTLFRLGPLVILQVILLGAGFILWLTRSVDNCICYACIQLSLCTFLLEMIVSLRLIKRNHSIRSTYLSIRIQQSRNIFYLRWIWDNLNFIFIFILLYLPLVNDGINLDSMASNKMIDNQSNFNICSFTVFSLCLFAETINCGQPKEQEIMIMWLLYSVTAFLVTVLHIAFGREYYYYCSSLLQNRKLSERMENLTQSLIDSTVYSPLMVSLEVSQGLGECAICLHKLIESDQKIIKCIIKLRCGHMFHRQCIDTWVKVKDDCPYRCNAC